jgi:threonine dehydratase
VLRHVDGIVTVTEEEIYAALRVILAATRLVAEPSGAVSLAAALFHAPELPRVHKVAVVLSGGNLEPALREKLMSQIASEATV